MPLRNLMAHVMESREMLGMMPPLTSPQPHDSTRRACGVLLTVQQPGVCETTLGYADG